MKLEMGANSHVMEALNVKLKYSNYSITLKIVDYYFIT